MDILPYELIVDHIFRSLTQYFRLHVLQFVCKVWRKCVWRSLSSFELRRIENDASCSLYRPKLLQGFYKEGNDGHGPRSLKLRTVELSANSLASLAEVVDAFPTLTSLDLFLTPFFPRGLKDKKTIKFIESIKPKFSRVKSLTLRWIPATLEDVYLLRLFENPTSLSLLAESFDFHSFLFLKDQIPHIQEYINGLKYLETFTATFSLEPPVWVEGIRELDITLRGESEFLAVLNACDTKWNKTLISLKLNLMEPVTAKREFPLEIRSQLIRLSLTNVRFPLDATVALPCIQNLHLSNSSIRLAYMNFNSISLEERTSFSTDNLAFLQSTPFLSEISISTSWPDDGLNIAKCLDILCKYAKNLQKIQIDKRLARLEIAGPIGDVQEFQLRSITFPPSLRELSFRGFSISNESLISILDHVNRSIRHLDIVIQRPMDKRLLDSLSRCSLLQWVNLAQLTFVAVLSEIEEYQNIPHEYFIDKLGNLKYLEYLKLLFLTSRTLDHRELRALIPGLEFVEITRFSPLDPNEPLPDEDEDI